MLIIKIIPSLILLAALLVVLMATLPKEGWRTRERFVRECESGNISHYQAQECIAYLLAKVRGK